MARSITLTLGAALGADLGPNFNLTADAGTVTPSTATKTELLAGKSVSVDDLATQVTVTSTGTCTNAITQTIPCTIQTTTTTSTSTSTTSTTTAAPSTSVDIYINNTNSLDIPITGMTINGVAVTFTSGTDFTIPAGNNGNFTSSQIGTHTVVIYYGAHIPGQNILFTDSDNAIACQNLNGSAGSFTINNAVITAGTQINVIASDGSCA